MDAALLDAVLTDSVFLRDGVVTATEMETFDSLLAFDSLLVAGLMTLPVASSSFIEDLTPSRLDTIDTVDRLVFQNTGLFASVHNPDSWPAEVRLRAAGILPALVENFDVRLDQFAPGNHIVDYKRDFDDILDDARVYPGIGVFSKDKGGLDYSLSSIRRRRYWDVLNTPESGFREFFLKKLAWHVAASSSGIIPVDLGALPAAMIERLYSYDGESQLGARGGALGRGKSTFIYPRTLGESQVVTVMSDVFRTRAACGLDNGTNAQLDEVICLAHGTINPQTGWNRILLPVDRFVGNYAQCFPRMPDYPSPGCLLYLRASTSEFASSTIVAYMSVLGIPCEQIVVGGNDFVRFWLKSPDGAYESYLIRASDWEIGESGGFIKE